jgi:hypothetical protein
VCIRAAQESNNDLTSERGARSKDDRLTAAGEVKEKLPHS